MPMDVSVKKGSTKEKKGTVLISESFTSSLGEHIVILLQAEASSTEAKTLQQECKTVIEHSLLETDGDAAERLDGTLKELNGLFKGLTFSQSISDVHAIVAVVDATSTLHTSHAGRAEAYVVRGGAATQITEYTRGKPTPAFVHIASGALEPKDTVIFSTQRLLRTVTPAQLAQLSARDENLMEELSSELEAEEEQAGLAIITVGGKAAKGSGKPLKSTKRKSRKSSGSLLSTITSPFSKVRSLVPGRLSDLLGGFRGDLKNPKRKWRVHLFLLAGVLASFLIIWAVLNLSNSSQQRQTRADLEQRLDEITQLIRTAENRRLSGELDSANTILEQAEQRAKQVMDNEANLFRAEALDLLERVRTKREEINNIVRLSPRPVVNLSTKNEDIDAQGLIGLEEGEFIAYDRQDLYRVLLNAVEDPDRLVDEELILDADNFPRYQTIAFQMTDNSLVELINGQATAMKTEDPAGWIKGKDIRTYLRFLYVLSPENNQIYKYERLSNRYTAPAEYNVNGDLEGALTMAIDGNVYILKEGGVIVKLWRGEVKPFTIRHLPDGALQNATKVFKVFDGNLYFLDPVHARIIVATDGGATGEGAYVKQYVLEGDQVGDLRDLWVDEEETKLYILDEKRVHVLDLR